MCRPKLPNTDALYVNEQPPVRFTQNFLSATVQGQDDGAYLSCPMGVLLLLATLLGSGGSRGNTATQVADALKIPKQVSGNDITSLRQNAKNMYWTLVTTYLGAQNGMNANRVPTVTLGNGAFIKKDYDILSDFTWSWKSDFNGKIEKVRFDHPMESVGIINTWVNNQTRGLVPSFVQSPNEIPKDTKLALISVLTFKEEWEQPFLEVFTQASDFWVKKGKAVKVAMMTATQSLPYAKFADKGFSLVEKPLMGKRFSMVFLLPNTRWDTSGMEKVLNGFYLLRDLLKQTQTVGVAIKIPRFRLEKQIDLIGPLRSLGINDLFNHGTADLSGITQAHRLYVNLMKQAAVLRVNEAGVEATAVTGMVAVPMSLIIANVQFHLDQPFICFIYDRQLKMPLFAARVVHPQV